MTDQITTALDYIKRAYGMHVHQYEEIAVQPKTTTEYHPFGNYNTASTLVLHRCKGCGDKNVQELEGEWTIEQVRDECD
jgi:hypothetical protein